VAVRSDGGTRTILGQSQLSFFNDIDGASGSINFSIGSGNLTAYLPGLIGHDVNWTLQYMGHGNQFGDRKV
jgi:hypothetical protein